MSKMKKFTVNRKSGYPIASFNVEKTKALNTCGCGTKIQAGELKITLSAGDSYPTTLCPKCAKKLIAVLQQIVTLSSKGNKHG
jgi:hypothetical protein